MNTTHTAANTLGAFDVIEMGRGVYATLHSVVNHDGQVVVSYRIDDGPKSVHTYAAADSVHVVSRWGV